MNLDNNTLYLYPVGKVWLLTIGINRRLERCYATDTPPTGEKKTWRNLRNSKFFRYFFSAYFLSQIDLWICWGLYKLVFMLLGVWNVVLKKLVFFGKICNSDIYNPLRFLHIYSVWCIVRPYRMLVNDV